ncbi:MAG: PLP-dependent aminotransferase family protein [Dissulfurispiraceae bacterium]|jgi:2-aminoadipate transaminase|nr:PLP-dependent aminotransferase family protein [Dissulfurispiraceae bacterium]
MSNIFSDRISDVPKSFIREILKVTVDRSIISFAGGLPNRDLFPIEEIKEATMKVLTDDPKDALQYSTSEGYKPLREYIAQRYFDKKGLSIDPDNILITNGSQQGLDLLGKILLNDGDDVIIEEPGYLGAIQALSIYKSIFHPISLNDDGIDIPLLKKVMSNFNVKLYYAVPNFQNPSGITYSESNRQDVASVLSDTRTLFVEDDPYGELRFLGSEKMSFMHLMPENTVLLGSFSKTVVPSFRIGWVTARKDVMEKLIVAKQAGDLHTNYFCQKILYEYLTGFNVDKHIEKIREAYRSQRESMVNAIHRYFPEGINYTEPEGGMFLWIELPKGISSLELFNRAIGKKVAFVPGDPFYVNKSGVNTLRLNFSCVDSETIDVGIKRLAEVIKEMM